MIAESFEVTFDEDFSRPVESIMRCEDFKSNFARKLSNRYTTRSPVSATQPETVMKLRTADKQDTLSNISEKNDFCTKKLSGSNAELNGEVVKPPDKKVQSSCDIRYTETCALNMKVETLRWQLAQTEANRQMHIALLKQIVTFLNRVKEHIELQQNEPENSMGSESLSKLKNMTDLPRSRSVFHVNKNTEYSISPVKKFTTRKISKSISNVNGCKDCTEIWNHTKMSLIPENEKGQKLTEEMSRLITLANTVLSTKLPDLACTCIEKSNEILQLTENSRQLNGVQNVSSGALNHIVEDTTDTIILEANCKKTTYNSVTNKFKDVHTRIVGDFIVSESSITCKLENESTGVKVFSHEQKVSQTELESVAKVHTDKTNDYRESLNFTEDESGFSSMSSFQEIGIPIISVIPRAPGQETDFLKEITSETDKWKKNTIELDKQSVKVFWV